MDCIRFLSYSAGTISLHITNTCNNDLLQCAAKCAGVSLFSYVLLPFWGLSHCHPFSASQPPTSSEVRKYCNGPSKQTTQFVNSKCHHCHAEFVKVVFTTVIPLKFKWHPMQQRRGQTFSSLLLMQTYHLE